MKRLMTISLSLALVLSEVVCAAQGNPSLSERNAKRPRSAYQFGFGASVGMELVGLLPGFLPGATLQGSMLYPLGDRWEVELHAQTGYYAWGDLFADGPPASTRILSLDVPIMVRRWAKGARNGWYWAAGLQPSFTIWAGRAIKGKGLERSFDVLWTPASVERYRTAESKRWYFLPISLAVPFRGGYRLREMPLEVSALLSVNVTPLEIAGDEGFLFSYVGISAGWWF